MSTSTTFGNARTTARTAKSGARRRTDASVIGQLNLEWAQLRTAPTTAGTVRGWAGTKPALAGCASLGDIESRVAAADRLTADEVLLALLELAVDDRLAGRVVLQLMLGKAVRIAAAQSGRADRALLEQLAVTALWDVIATYPVHRRRQKVAANLSMDTLRQVVAELAPDRVESPAEPTVLAARTEDDEPVGAVPDLELYEVLAWGVDEGVISRSDAALVTQVYCAAPGEPGGAEAAAAFGLSWAAARQRCSRAVRKLAAAVQQDAYDAAA